MLLYVVIEREIMRTLTILFISVKNTITVLLLAQTFLFLSGFSQLSAQENEDEAFTKTSMPNTEENFLEDSIAENSLEKKVFDFNGIARNDSLLLCFPKDVISFATKGKNQCLFSNIFELRFVLDINKNDFNIYTDIRTFLYLGEIAKQKAKSLTQNSGSASVGSFQKSAGVEFKLMRSFLRYFISNGRGGQLTLGKTYISLGNRGIFNPFELNQGIRFSDMSYAKEGVLALEYYVPWQETSGVKFFVGSRDIFFEHPVFGIAPQVHVGTFKLGMVFSRFQKNHNIVGFYFKGDAVIGIEGSYSLSLLDKKDKASKKGFYHFSEMNIGIDYSLFGGRFFFAIQYYFDEAGAKKSSAYKKLLHSSFMGQHYMKLVLSYKIDEFYQLELDMLMNFTDISFLFLPSFTTQLANALSLKLQLVIPTAKGVSKKKEFSQASFSATAILLRLEGKF